MPYFFFVISGSFWRIRRLFSTTDGYIDDFVELPRINQENEKMRTPPFHDPPDKKKAGSHEEPAQG